MLDNITAFCCIPFGSKRKEQNKPSTEGKSADPPTPPTEILTEVSDTPGENDTKQEVEIEKRKSEIMGKVMKQKEDFEKE